MSILENEAIKYAEGDYLKGVASVERMPSHEIINAFPGFIKTKLKYAFIAGAYYRDALLAEGKKFDRQKETKTCDNCKHSDLPRGYEPCVYCRNKDDWEPKENPCSCTDGTDSKAGVGCEYSEDGKPHPFENYHCYGCDKSSKKGYRPYETVHEFIQDYQDRFPTTNPRPCYTLPFIWLRNKNKKDERELVYCFRDLVIKMDNTYWDMNDLFDQWEYLDGSPCGMEVKE